MSKKVDKTQYYTQKIAAALSELFNEDSEHYIDKDELMEDDNLTDFSHSLSNQAPCIIYSSITGDDKNLLQFNHMANHLCFQYMNVVEKEV